MSTHLYVGTGASCIYPLLCVRLNGWRFTATEIDPVSVQCAIKNVRNNNFDTNITGMLLRKLVSSNGNWIYLQKMGLTG